MKRAAFAACLALSIATLYGQAPVPSPANSGPNSKPNSTMDALAEQYVKTVLALGRHDADYVDAYYGPPEWKKEADGTKVDLDAIGSRAGTLRSNLKPLMPPANAPVS